MAGMALRVYVKTLTKDELIELIDDHEYWERKNFLPLDSRIREIAKSMFNDDAILICDRVMFEVYRECTLRWLEGE